MVLKQHMHQMRGKKKYGSNYLAYTQGDLPVDNREIATAEK